MTKNPILFWSMMLVAVCMTSCLKSKNNSNQSNPTQVTFINVSPSRPGFNVSMDGATKGNDTTFPYMSYDSVGAGNPALNYFPTYAGIHFIQFTNTVTDSVFTSGNIQFANGTKYSIYLFDTITGAGLLSAVQIQDTWDSIPLAVPTSLIRFLNFCPDSTGIDVIYNDTTLWYPYVNFQFIGNGSLSATSLSQYTAFPAGAYIFEFFHAGSENPVPDYPGSLVDNKPTTQPFDTLYFFTQPQKAYTIVASGFYDSLPPSPVAFKLQVIQMN